MRLGLVTYNLAKDWDLETIIRNCEETGFEGVELRTTHHHGVEVDLSGEQRAAVRRRFEESAVELAGLGSAFEYHALDQGELRRNIEGTKEYAELARDVGAPGIKVRPNGVHDEAGVPREKTFEQIGLALRECGEFAAGCGVEIRLEVHGRITCHPPYIRRILDHAGHDNVLACWNSNTDEVEGGGLDANFAQLRERLGLVHINELWSAYPWKRLFQLLKERSYEGYCLAEIPPSADPLCLMRYYRALWGELVGQ